MDLQKACENHGDGSQSEKLKTKIPIIKFISNNVRPDPGALQILCNQDTPTPPAHHTFQLFQGGSILREHLKSSSESSSVSGRTTASTQRQLICSNNQIHRPLHIFNFTFGGETCIMRPLWQNWLFARSVCPMNSATASYKLSLGCLAQG